MVPTPCSSVRHLTDIPPPSFAVTPLSELSTKTDASFSSVTQRHVLTLWVIFTVQLILKAPNVSREET